MKGWRLGWKVEEREILLPFSNAGRKIKKEGAREGNKYKYEKRIRCQRQQNSYMSDPTDLLSGIEAGAL